MVTRIHVTYILMERGYRNKMHAEVLFYHNNRFEKEKKAYPNAVPFGKAKKSLAFRSLIRTFALKF